MENLENRLQRVEKALKSMTAPVKRIFDDALAAEKKKQKLQQQQPQPRQVHDINLIPEGNLCYSFSSIASGFNHS